MILDAKKTICYIPCYMPSFFSSLPYSSLPYSSLLFSFKLAWFFILSSFIFFFKWTGGKIKKFHHQFSTGHFYCLVKAKTQKRQKNIILWRLISGFFFLVWQRCILIGTLGHASDTASTWFQLLISYYYPFPLSTLILTTVSCCLWLLLMTLLFG
ncbi:hypothetical protein HDV63DRAFT_151446 [Trichoderma sp. SZMC 28014]